MREGYVLEFDGGFDRNRLDPTLWVPAHLPQWSSREQAAARYRFRSGQLVLHIDEDQPPWCPEFDRGTKVSNLQTGVHSGPAGSGVGQHRFNDRVVVRQEQESVRLYTPTFGYFELRAKAAAHPATMIAFWMIGFEDRPERSGEICICEIFGSEVDRSRALVGMGVHPFGDPNLKDDFEKVEVGIDSTQFHVYAAEWLPEGIDFFVDGRKVKTVSQTPQYPMQLMLGIYEFDDGSAAELSKYPKEFVVDYVRAWRPPIGIRTEAMSSHP